MAANTTAGASATSRKPCASGMANSSAPPSRRAFTAGEFYGLNHANKENPHFGRVGDETVSGHWLYAFLRRDTKTGQAFLVVANFHGSETLRGVQVSIPEDAWKFLGRTGKDRDFTDRLDGGWSGQSGKDGMKLPDMPPCSALILEISK